jgi:superfamily II DNA or RNA helicase
MAIHDSTEITLTMKLISNDSMALGEVGESLSGEYEDLINRALGFDISHRTVVRRTEIIGDRTFVITFSFNKKWASHFPTLSELADDIETRLNAKQYFGGQIKILKDKESEIGVGPDTEALAGNAMNTEITLRMILQLNKGEWIGDRSLWEFRYHIDECLDSEGKVKEIKSRDGKTVDITLLLGEELVSNFEGHKLLDYIKNQLNSGGVFEGRIKGLEEIEPGKQTCRDTDVISQGNEFLEFKTDGHTFKLSQYKVSLIYKYIDDLKEYWSLPIEPRGQYIIQPSDRKSKWHVNNISGYKLSYILNNVAQINERLDLKYRLNSLVLSDVQRRVQEISSKCEPPDLFEIESELYQWQKEALKTWYNNEGKRGIVEAATGTGKTRLAFACMGKFFEDSPDGLVCIVVPRQPLFDQWQEGLHDYFLTIPENNYCYNGNGHTDVMNRDTHIIITTQQAMVLKGDSSYGCALMKQLGKLGRDVFIVFDEAHHLGAKQTMDRFVRYIPKNFYTLGLTATPDRRDGTMDRVYLYFDCETSKGPIYSYPLSRAVEEGVLTRVIQKNYRVSLNDDENKSHQQFCEQIRDIKKRIIDNIIIRVDRDRINSGSIAYLVELEHELIVLQARDTDSYGRAWGLINKIRMLKTVYIERRRLFNKAEEKWELLKSLLSDSYWTGQFTNGRWIFFHQEIDECENTARLLMNSFGEEKVRSHHSRMMADERQNVLVEFDKNVFNCLCAVQTLDEGLDIPDLTGVVIISGSASRRQQIQRCGRALRQAPNKACAYLVAFLAQVDEDLTGEKLLIGPDSSTDRWTIEEYTYYPWERRLKELENGQAQKQKLTSDRTPVVSPNDSSQIDCRLCNKSFDRKYLFGLHLYDEHMPKKAGNPYDCPVCRKKYKYANRWGLALHWFQEHHM